MIEAQELRIGNWVKNIYGNEVQITVIDDTVTWPKPIPLTPEWLERAGFEHILNNLEDFYAIDYEEGEFYFGLSEYMDSYHIHGYHATYMPIRYVHQLQNLYFALTGQELKLNDK